MPARSPIPARTLSLSAAAILTLTPLHALAQSNPPQTPLHFEVATIKPVLVPPAASAPSPGIRIYPNGRVVISAFSFKALIETAFHLGFWQLSGGEGWMDNHLYDIVAQPPQDSPPTRYDTRFGWVRIEDPRLRQMLQALLIDRFQLKLLRQTVTGPIYLLEKSGKPIPLRPADVPIPADPSGGEGIGTVGNASDNWTMYNTSMPQLANWVGDYYLHRPVIDQTGLAGYFTYRWKMVLTNPDDDPQMGSKDELMDFIKVMGLKLVPSTGPVDTYVIDSAQLPSPN
jgi:uncharacterized protein (TIGR03435 family)